MDRKKLFNLRGEENGEEKIVIRTDKSRKIAGYLRDLFGENTVFPLIVGRMGDRMRWKIVNLEPFRYVGDNPKDVSKMTIDNYICALEEYSNWWVDFTMNYSGVDSLKDIERKEGGIPIFEACVKNASGSGMSDSGFELKLSAASSEHQGYPLGYIAHSGIRPSAIEKHCANFVGPHRIDYDKY